MYPLKDLKVYQKAFDLSILIYKITKTFPKEESYQIRFSKPIYNKGKITKTNAMPKKAYLANYYSSVELKQKYIKSKDSVETRRWHLLWKVSIGWTIKDSSIAVGFNYNYGKEIVKKYNELGEKGVKNLKNKHRQQVGGKKSLLTDEQLDSLKKALESNPSDGGFWTGPKVARWIEKETGIEKVWNQRGWDYLNKVQILMAESETKT